MKHADSLTPTETLYESRLYEAIQRKWDEVRGLGAWGDTLHIFRQMRIRCKSYGACDCKKHRRGKLWIVDFYIWPNLVIEVDGHTVDAERDYCLTRRGLRIIHIPNAELYEMESAMSWAHEVIATAKENHIIKQKLVQLAATTPEAVDDICHIAALLGLGPYPKSATSAYQLYCFMRKL